MCSVDVLTHLKLEHQMLDVDLLGSFSSSEKVGFILWSVCRGFQEESVATLSPISSRRYLIVDFPTYPRPPRSSEKYVATGLLFVGPSHHHFQC